MHLYEYQVKKIFTFYGLTIPLGYVCSSIQEAEKAMYKIGSDGPWVVKCQIYAGGRSKSGGVKIVKSKEEMRIFIKRWLGQRLITYQSNFIGQIVNKFLVERIINFKKELYFSIIIDYDLYRIIVMASTSGGINIEQSVATTPNLIYKVFIDVVEGPMPYQGRELAVKLGLKNELVKKFTRIFMNSVTMFLDLDLTLIEINPLVINSNEDFICLDGKLVPDRNALFRNPKLQKIYDQSQEDSPEIQAAKWKLNYVTLDGNIGCMVNGAGLAMSTVDIIKLHGGNLANFLDIGGEVTKKSVVEAFRIILSANNIKVILINIFGGITDCSLIADSIIYAIREMNVNMPIVSRLEGNNSKLGINKLKNSGLNIILANNLTDLAKKVLLESEKKNHVYFGK